jgi:four helix bundle protein
MTTLDSRSGTQEQFNDAAPGRRPIHSYHDIEAFQRAMTLLRPVHRLALKLPDYEKFDLASQLRRASKSIPANVAEGYGKRRSSKQFRAYLENALGSTDEIIVHLEIALVLEYCREQEGEELIAEYQVVGRMLARMIERSQW